MLLITDYILHLEAEILSMKVPLEQALFKPVVFGRSSIIIVNQSFTSLILINQLQNWQSIIIGKGDT